MAKHAQRPGADAGTVDDAGEFACPGSASMQGASASMLACMQYACLSRECVPMLQSNVNGLYSKWRPLMITQKTE